ncbi:CBS domain-containing protein [Haloarculaceae archaeon H-GB2-1]|nr:CBS domain-containing protein [Haloarculaceae archaeon H-GB1-1]MEA5386902.1 CBS domain-containing protein [Haloarculaceae archaeon H-GB11]MEA5408383.1 CBS domain-containing protein [Haloarculaceae archaeon H-GB2-1]
MDIQNLVSKDYVSVSADTPVSKLVGEFEDPEVKGIVVDDADGFAGVVTRRQLAASHQKPNEKARSLVWHVPTVSPRTDVREAARLMVDGDTRLLPVYEGKQMVGVVTGSDILDAVQPFLDAATVGEVASTDLVTVDPTTTFGEALHHLRENRITHLPVVDADEAVGILSLYDVVDYTARTVTKSQGGNGQARDHGGFGGREGERARLLDLPVRDMMVSPVRTIRPSQGLDEAVEEMAAVGGSSLVVVDDDGSATGIVTTTDILDALTWEAEGNRAVQVSGVDHLDDASYSDVVAMVEDLERVAGKLNVFDAKVHLHQHDEKLRGTRLVMANMRLYTDKGTFLASGEGYGAKAALNEAKDIMERRIRDDNTYGRSKKHPDEEYWEKRFGWWLEE